MTKSSQNELTNKHGVSLKTRNLSCSRNDVVLISGLEFSISEGQLLLVEGPNGSGKTTLLKTICGLIEPDEGEIMWRDHHISSMMEEYLAELNYVGHHNGIKLALTVVENLKTAMALASVNCTDKLDPVLDLFGLDAYKETSAQLLSSGLRRRLALARLATCAARLWVLDEPFTSLDTEGRYVIKGLFQDHMNSGGIIVMTSHDDIDMDGTSIVRIHL